MRQIDDWHCRPREQRIQLIVAGFCFKHCACLYVCVCVYVYFVYLSKTWVLWFWSSTVQHAAQLMVHFITSCARSSDQYLFILLDLIIIVCCLCQYLFGYSAWLPSNYIITIIVVVVELYSLRVAIGQRRVKYWQYINISQYIYIEPISKQKQIHANRNVWLSNPIGNQG